MKAVQEFFAANPEANECYTAIGYARATETEAQALLAGISGQKVEKHLRIVEGETDAVKINEAPAEEVQAPVQQKKKNGTKINAHKH